MKMFEYLKSVKERVIYQLCLIDTVIFSNFGRGSVRDAMMAKSGQSIKRFFDIWDMNGFLITPTTTTLPLNLI